QHPTPPLLTDPEPGRVRLDVRRINALQLEQLGIDPAQMAIAPHCTYEQPEHFFSYRRSRLKQVQWSGIVSQLSR
ncbi:MAG: laccase domain-containing protein, partial [Cyanothece sp. SIO1E1]|nr:laccase domain-containing protein [Cyanothece sp. SIO1E1]